MKVFKLNKGLAGLQEDARAGGWESAEQFANEAQLSDSDVDSMYWLSDWDETREVDVTGMPVVDFRSVSSIGERCGSISRNRYYYVGGKGYLAQDGTLYISEDEFTNVFC